MTFSERTTQWINGTMMTSVRSLGLTAAAIFAIVLFSVIASIMLLDTASAVAALNKDAGIRAAAQATETSHRNYGMQLATLVFGFLTAAIITNAASQANDRSTSKEHVKAKGDAQAAVESAKASVANGTTEHAALPVTTTMEATGAETVKMTTTPAEDTHPTTPTVPVPDDDGHEWANGDEKQAGVL